MEGLPRPYPVLHRATELPEAPTLGAFPTTPAPLRPQLHFLSPSPQVSVCWGFCFGWKRRRRCLHVWLFPPFSHSLLPPSCLSRCFLCQPGSTPASPLPGQAAAIPLPAWGFCGLWLFPECALNTFLPRGGVHRARTSEGGAPSASLLPPLLKAHISWWRRQRGLTGLPPAWGSSLLLSLISWEPTAGTAPWHRGS